MSRKHCLLSGVITVQGFYQTSESVRPEMASRARTAAELADGPRVVCLCDTASDEHTVALADALAQTYGDVTRVYLVDAACDLAARYGSTSLPAFVAEGATAALYSGDALKGPVHDPAAIAALLDAVRLEARLRAMVASEECVLFIKGTADAPRCGFTTQVLALMREQNVRFVTFDILADEDVRQGLKRLFDWPTFPQIYLRGELVGGLDIMRDLVASGDFASMSFPVV